MPDAYGRFKGISVPELPWQRVSKLERAIREMDEQELPAPGEKPDAPPQPERA